MKRISVDRRNIGLVYNAESSYATVWAPMAKKVTLSIAGTNYPLSKDDRGYWSSHSIPAQPGEPYHFVLDGKTLPDPASLSQPDGVHSPSHVFDATAFHWTDGDWINPPIEKYIFYEIHTGTFTPGGTLNDIAQKLDHLVALGITAIEIMPVGQFPGTRNWGYDGVFPFAVQNTYGGPEALQRLVNTCHEKGLAVVLDVVYNHLGPEGNYLPSYGPCFTDKYKTPWGQAINFDDEWCDGVRGYFIENALMWFRDFHVDALRLDAVHAIRDFSASHILEELKEYTNELMAQTGRTYYLVAESDLNDRRFIDPLEKRGYGMDAQWNDEFHHALRVCAGNERHGYYSDFVGVQDLARSYEHAYVYDGIYSQFRKRTFGSNARGLPGSRFVVCSQNHDQVGNRALGERTSMLVSFEMQKLLAGAVMVSPFLPLLFMGEEWGAGQPFQYFTHHGDEDLVKAVREGRTKEFSHFHKDVTCPDPQAIETFNNCKLHWDDISTPPHYVLLKYYRRLIALRKSTPALYLLNREHVQASVDAGKQTLTLHRWHGMQHVLCAMNFSALPQRVDMPNDIAYDKLLDSAAEEWGGPGGTDEDRLAPQSIRIYCNQDV